MLYNQKILSCYQKIRNVGELDINDPNVGTGILGSVAYGNLMKLQILVKQNKIIDAKFKVYGCGFAIAAVYLVTELIKQKTIEQAKAINYADSITKSLDFPSAKTHCANLAQNLAMLAIDDYCKKNHN